MSTPIPSDMSIISVNQALNDALLEYLDDSIVIRFDLPDPDNLPAEPVISVFLYDLHEDLRLNTAESRQYSQGILVPGNINVCCNYLITYWDAQAVSSGGPGSEPASQAMVVMNQVMNALINHRQLAGIPGAFTRVMPPKEELNSLGNFWQSLGNKPRLVLNYSVTVPVSLTDRNDNVPSVQSVQHQVNRI
ncbi:Pvc16 family protein [Shewanella sp. YLB-07]|uniref:Pvc16 family protein n=1 Tax=Shewanella sp. YLB-07 TaxID=2601268 RepID=UPI00128B2712|nr:Pvc16 family protein [Shewanella sp. YLB-07]MPY24375.1 DUF4255 domain-containing protein [Shewanella sp. YLB-07]